MQIHLNSKYAIQNYNNIAQCTFNLGNISYDSTYEIYISVQHAVIPHTFLNVNQTNNLLYYTLSDDFYDKLYSLVIPT